MIEYKVWEGKWPHVILLSPERAIEVLYYETGFEQLHPIPDIIEWVEERGHKYHNDWRVVRVEEDRGMKSDWAICFKDRKILELFVLKWL